MPVFWIILGAVVAVGAILRLTHKPEDESTVEKAPEPAAGECCGEHAVCERDSLLTVPGDTIEYYDDEELDALADRDPASYSAEEVEKLREVMLTLLPDDVAGWARSIQQRRIALPEDVRDELLLLVSEVRQSRRQENR